MTPDRREQLLLQNVMIYVAMLYRLRKGKPARLHQFDLNGLKDTHYHERYPRGSST